jgi:hypothetical protein
LGYNFRRAEELRILEQRNFSGVSLGFKFNKLNLITPTQDILLAEIQVIWFNNNFNNTTLNKKITIAIDGFSSTGKVP